MPTDQELLQGELFAPRGTDFVRCPARAVPYWRINMIIGNCWLGAFIAVPTWLIAILWQDSTWWWMALSAVVVPLGVWRWFREKTEWRITGYYLGPEQLWVRGGLGDRSLSVAAYGRIQNCDVSSTFWSRKFNLATVRVNTGARSYLSIQSIDPDEAARIRDLLADVALKKGVQL